MVYCGLWSLHKLVLPIVHNRVEALREWCSGLCECVCQGASQLRICGGGWAVDSYLHINPSSHCSLCMQSRLPVYIAHTPAGTSVQNVAHYAQVGHCCAGR